MQDKQYIQNYCNFLQPRFTVRHFDSWEELEVATMQDHPCILLYDVEPPTYEARNLIQLLLVHQVRTVFFRDGDETREKAPFQVVINKSDPLPASLKAIMRLVLGFTGSFEYNAMEFLKENLVDVYCALLRREMGIHVAEDPLDHISSVHDADTTAKELSSTIRYDVVVDNLRISFALRGKLEEMRLLVERAMKKQIRDGEVAELIRGWNSAMQGIADNLKRVLTMFGIEWQACEVTTRLYIDRLLDDYHWYITRNVALDHVHGFSVIFGVSLSHDAQTGVAQPEQQRIATS